MSAAEKILAIPNFPLSGFSIVFCKTKEMITIYRLKLFSGNIKLYTKVSFYFKIQLTLYNKMKVKYQINKIFQVCMCRYTDCKSNEEGVGIQMRGVGLQWRMQREAT